MMDKELKQKWVDALRSGKYIQGTGTLCQINNNSGERRYCCLGVLADVAGLESSIFDDGYTRALSFEDHTGALSKKFAREVGIFTHKEDESLGYVTAVWVESRQSYLTELNDRDKLSFNEIADVIEENF